MSIITRSAVGGMRKGGKGTVEDKLIENGVMVPAGLLVNGFDLAGHQDDLWWRYGRRQQLTRKEALAIGYDPAEVEAWFGPEARE